MFYHLGIFVRLYVRRRIFRKISRKVNPLRTSCVSPFSPFFTFVAGLECNCLTRVGDFNPKRSESSPSWKATGTGMKGETFVLWVRFLESISWANLSSQIFCLKGGHSELFGPTLLVVRPLPASRSGAPTGLVGRNCEFPALFKEIEEVVKEVENFRLSGDVRGTPF